MVAREGQTLLTGGAWRACHMDLPVESSVLHVGGFSVFGRDEELFQVMPMMLFDRQFSPPETGEKIRPGFDDSPAVVDETGKRRGIAICFTNVSPARDDVDDEARTAGTTAWQKICRETLVNHGGYECKEPDPGKFTLAFADVLAAATFCVEARRRLDESTTTSSEIKVAMGVAFGDEVFRKPLLATGRADYFGALPNLAARVMGQARGGQALVEMTDRVAAAVTVSSSSSGGVTTCHDDGETALTHRAVDGGQVTKEPKRYVLEYSLKATTTATGRNDHVASAPSASSSAVILREVGYCGLKGIQAPRLLLEIERPDPGARDGKSGSLALDSDSFETRPEGFISFSRAEAEEHRRALIQAEERPRESATLFSSNLLKNDTSASVENGDYSRSSATPTGVYGYAKWLREFVFSAKFSSDPFDVEGFVDVQKAARRNSFAPSNLTGSSRSRSRSHSGSLSGSLRKFS